MLVFHHKSTGKQVQQIDIYYQFVGKLDEI
ncbi:DUF4368 domain-containing protein [Enterococcus durans]|nr:DUF4368 domain-containing protein [Lactobacillus sp.]